MTKIKSYSGYPWIMDRIKRENPGKTEDEIKRMYLSVVKSQSLPCLIEKYGKEEGERRYSKRSKNVGFGHTLDGFISRYGEEDGKSKYKKYIDSKSSTLDNLIKKYGEEEGLRRYEERCNKISNSSKLDGFISRYGDELGRNLYYSHADKSKNTLENFISRYGEKNGPIKWTEYLIKLSKRRNTSYSKISLELFESIKNKLVILGYDESDIFYGDSEYVLSVNLLGLNKTVTFLPDFYLKSKKLVIEFYGDYWHKNPESLSESDNGEEYSDLWEWDELRIRSMYHSEYVDSIMIVWESEYRSDKEGTINKLIKFLTDYGKN